MTPVRFGLTALAFALPLAACAAVTGLGDYELTECPGPCADATADAWPTPNADVFTPSAPKDGGQTTGDDATVLADAAPDAPVDSGIDAGVDAGPPVYTPSCARTSCSGLGAPITCVEHSCDVADRWPKTQVSQSDIHVSGGDCITTSGAVAGSRATISNSLPGGARYDFELRLLVSQRGSDDNSGTILQISSGATTITVAAVSSGKAKLCVNGNCSAEIAVPGLGPLDGQGGILDLYGRWGDSVTDGYVRLLTEASCTQRFERPLPTTASGALQVQIGCFENSCDLQMDDISFSQRPF